MKRAYQISKLAFITIFVLGLSFSTTWGQIWQNLGQRLIFGKQVVIGRAFAHRIGHPLTTGKNGRPYIISPGGLLQFDGQHWDSIGSVRLDSITA